MPEIGTTLREARMRARIDISEIEAETKIRAKYLRALENEEWDLLPGPTFVRSFLRTYAEALDLDAKLLLEEYKLRHDRPSEQELLPISPRTTPGRKRPEPRGVPRAYLVGLVLLALLGVFYVLGRGDGGDDDGSKTIVTAPAQTGTVATGSAPASTTGTTPSKATPPASTKKASRNVRLQIIPQAAVYACLEAAGDRRLINGVVLQPSGGSQTYRSSRFRLTLGNGQVQLRINGRTRGVPNSSDPIGYEITRKGRRVLPESQRPTCGG